MKRVDSGYAMILMLVVVVALMGLSGALSQTTFVVHQGTHSQVSRIKAEQISQVGLSQGQLELASLYDYDVAPPVLRTAGDPTLGTTSGNHGGGAFTVTRIDNADGSVTLHSIGVFKEADRIIELTLNPADSEGGIYWMAMFAGNHSGDATYSMDFGGVGNSGDQVNGDIFSGNDITVTGDATITGEVNAIGTITGIEGGDTSYPLPDLSSMDYANSADVKVAEIFDASATYQSDEAGGSAYQVPESNAAHIFRKNPSDRTSETTSTTKDDYFLEDPYEPVRSDPNQNGSDAYHLSIDAGGNHKVYYIDGNLWLHNKNSYSFKFFTPESSGMQVTFVVRGNIYMSDNLFYLNKNKDAVVFIAEKDAAVADSGNIYIGDPVFGTVKELNSFLYAENTFYDNNLDNNGSAEFTINGNMTAGNQLEIDNRDYTEQVWVQTGPPWCFWCGYWDTVQKHAKMTVNFDERIRLGTVDLPGLPTGSGAGSGSGPKPWKPVAWKMK